MEKQTVDVVKPLDRYLSPVDVWAIAFGCMVGWGVFAMPGSTFLPIAGPAGTLVSMLLGLAMTANAFKEDELAVLKAGMQAHIAKPVDIDLLMKTLASVLLTADDKKV